MFAVSTTEVNKLCRHVYIFRVASVIGTKTYCVTKKCKILLKLFDSDSDALLSNCCPVVVQLLSSCCPIVAHVAAVDAN
jgi:hypothetical protein